MNLYEYVSYDKEYLTEGITLFKNSKRLENLSNKLEKKISIYTSIENKEEIRAVVNKLRVISKEFRLIEEKYKNANKDEKKEIKNSEYAQLENKYFDLVALLNKESVKKTLKAVGGLGIMSVIFLHCFNILYNYGVVGNIMFNKAMEQPIEYDSLEQSRKAIETKRKIANAVINTDKVLKNNSLEYQNVITKKADLAKQFLKAEKEISVLTSGAATVSSGIVYGIFLKLFGKVSGSKTRLYYKTKNILDKMKE